MSCYRVFVCNLPAIQIPDRPCTLILSTLILSTLLLCILFAIRASRGTSLTPCPCRPVTCSFNLSELCYSRHPNPQAPVYLVLSTSSSASFGQSSAWINQTDSGFSSVAKGKHAAKELPDAFSIPPLTGDHAETQGMSFGTYMNRRKEKLQSPVHLVPACHVSGGLC